MKRYYYDIETEGLPAIELAKVMPDFEAPGNIKDPLKIAAAIEEKKKDWTDKAALKGYTGRIIALSYAANDTDEPHFVADTGDEDKIIKIMLDHLTEVISQGGMAFAWNGSGFDLPFLCQRAAVHNIPAFGKLMVNVRGKFYWNEALIDPKMIWANYSPDHTGTSLATVAKALGVGEKSGSGKDFAQLLRTDAAAAEAYGKQDIALLRSIVIRMGL